MNIVPLLFYAFGIVAVVSALMVVASPNPVRGALSLVLTFFATAGVWLLLHAEFLALVLVLVYVGAVMTLFLFVVMMLSIKQEGWKQTLVKYLPYAVVMMLLITGIMLSVVSQDRFGAIAVPEESSISNIQALGSVLYTQYVYPFEIAAVILLTAIIAAISLTHRRNKSSKAQVISQQIAVNAKDRIELIKMPPSSPPSSEGSE